MKCAKVLKMAVLAFVLGGCSILQSVPTITPSPAHMTVTPSPAEKALEATRFLPAITLTLVPSPNPATQLVQLAGGDIQISGDGRSIVYTPLSGAFSSVYLYDQVTNRTTAISAMPDGSLTNGIAASISDDGNTIAFFSSGLTADTAQDCPAEAQYCGSLYLYDKQSGHMKRIRVGTSFPVQDTALSADGRYVAFESSEAYLHSGVFLYDSLTERLIQISHEGVAVDISADGRVVAFVSREDGLVPNDTNGANDVFVYDLNTTQIERVSTPMDSIESGQPSGAYHMPYTGSGGLVKSMAISANGRYVVFGSAAPNLTSDDLPGCKNLPLQLGDNTEASCPQVYLYDRVTDQTEIISLTNKNEPAIGDAFNSVDVSEDGRLVVFVSSAANLWPDPPPDCNQSLKHPCGQVFARDRELGQTYLLGLGRGSQSPGEIGVVITRNGRYAAFWLVENNTTADQSASGETGNIFITDLSMLPGRGQ